MESHEFQKNRKEALLAKVKRVFKPKMRPDKTRTHYQKVEIVPEEKV